MFCHSPSLRKTVASSQCPMPTVHSFILLEGKDTSKLSSPTTETPDESVMENTQPPCLGREMVH